MKVRAQAATLWLLDRCTGCGACVAACKTVWTSHAGSEHMWWIRLARTSTGGTGEIADQEGGGRAGGWKIEGDRLKPVSFRRRHIFTRLFHHPQGPVFENRDEPWRLDFESALRAPLAPEIPHVQLVSAITGEPLSATGTTPLRSTEAVKTDRDGTSLGDEIPLVSLETTGRPGEAFRFPLPVLCGQCLNPSCVAACPSSALYKRAEDGIVLVDPTLCRGWAVCTPACPYGMTATNWQGGQAGKCHFCFPLVESGRAPFCVSACPTGAVSTGWIFYDQDGIGSVAAGPEAELVPKLRQLVLDPTDSTVIRLASGEVPASILEAARHSPVYRYFVTWELALPLHPEWRTLPMSFYVPPLPPGGRALDNRGDSLSDSPDGTAAALARLFAAGEVRWILRSWRRQRAVLHFQQAHRRPGASRTESADEELRACGLDHRTAREILDWGERIRKGEFSSPLRSAWEATAGNESESRLQRVSSAEAGGPGTSGFHTGEG